MNEIELIRTQLSVERQHATAVARACAATLASASMTSSEPFRAASIEYLAWILARFEEREQVFHDLIRKRFAAEDPHRQAVEAALGSPGSNREALTKLEAALSQGADANTTTLRWSEFLHFFSGPWSVRRDELDRLLQQHPKVTDWRTVSAIDADSIVDERARWARVEATMPTDTELSSNTSTRVTRVSRR
jgi:hypothetical protein